MEKKICFFYIEDIDTWFLLGYSWWRMPWHSIADVYYTKYFYDQIKIFIQRQKFLNQFSFIKLKTKPALPKYYKELDSLFIN